MTATASRPKSPPSWRERLRMLGPGVITGAADDDPSGIATYSQAGAQFGYGVLWTLVFTLPLMAAIQIVSARIGYVTRRGLMANLRAAYPRPAVLTIAGLLIAANTLNIAADLAAMADAVRLLIGGPTQLYAIGFGVLSLLLQVMLPYERYVRWLKWLTLALLAYVAVAFSVKIDWAAVLHSVVLPSFPKGTTAKDFIVLLVAVLGTTISPYLFFWQAAQEMEEATEERKRSAAEVKRHLRRIKVDTIVGMTFSNTIAFFIMVSTAATLHAAGVTTIGTSAQAAEALRPLAGEFTFLLFALGIVGTGLLAVPVLAGSAAYGVAEAAGWPASLELGLKPGRRDGRSFYAVLAIATIGGAIICVAPIDPMRALIGAAVANGVIAVPIMAVMMLLATNRRTMGNHAIGTRLKRLGWTATALMAVTVIAMVATSI